MKNSSLFLLLFGLGISILGHAQNCDEKVASINTMLKAKNFSGAYVQWNLSEKCLTEAEVLYSYGEKILENRINNAASPDEKSKAIDELLNLYANYDKNFPVNKNSNNVKKAILLHKNKIGKPEVPYSLLQNAFLNDRANFVDANALYTYFEMQHAKYQQGDKSVPIDDVFALRDDILATLSDLRSKSVSGQANYKTAIDGINSLVAPIATCENLISYYEKGFDKKKNDARWLETAANTLSAKNCTTDNLFVAISNEWYKVAPTAKSAYNLGMANLRGRNSTKAAEYFNIAVDLETDPKDKAKMAYTAATSLNSNKEESVKFIRKAIASDPAFGKPYLYLAQLFAGSAKDCNLNDFDKKAIFMLAAQTAEKAGASDKYLLATSKKVSENYLKNAPTQQEIKAAGKAGKKITFGCWINETLTLPAK